MPDLCGLSLPQPTKWINQGGSDWRGHRKTILVKMVWKRNVPLGDGPDPRPLRTMRKEPSPSGPGIDGDDHTDEVFG